MSDGFYDADDPLLKPSAAAKRLGVNPETIRRWMRKGVIDFIEVGPFKRKRLRQSTVDNCRVERESTA